MSDSEDRELNTTGGKFRLFEYRLHDTGREWTVLHAGAVLTDADETHAIVLKTNRIPYGVSLWPSAIALSHEIVTRADAFRGRSMLELGAGIGLPGIVAASVGAKVVQTDRDELVAHLGKRNSSRNGLDAVEYRLADWTAWGDAERYDWIVGSDILYSDSFHPHLRRIFESNLAPGGRILLADPFRALAFQFLETLESQGWAVTFTRWDVGQEASSRPVGVFELIPQKSGPP